jgi:hypothetical protein
MTNSVLIAIDILACAAAAVLWLEPTMLRWLAAHLWARAHAVETARKAHRTMFAAVMREAK